MDEVDIALVLASFATIVGETRDFAVVLLNGSAGSIAQLQLSSPGFTAPCRRRRGPSFRSIRPGLWRRETR